MSVWVASFILEYDDPRFFKRTGYSTRDNLFVGWLNDTLGLRDVMRGVTASRWNMFSTEIGEPWGVKVVFKRKSDAALFKLTWF